MSDLSEAAVADLNAIADKIDLDKITEEREQAVRTYLVSTEQIQPDRVLIVDSGSTDTVDSGPGGIQLDIR